jgi:hypothetical protein
MLLDPRIADVVHLRDDIGVLSLYVGIDPAAEAKVWPPWGIELDAGLRSLRDELHDEGDHKRWVAFDRRLAALAPARARLVDAHGRGRGRALFAAIGSGETYTLAVQAALPTKVMLGDVAHVVPLLRVDDGHPRGFVLVGRDRVRMLETRLGEVVELAAFDVEPFVVDGPERKGPAAANPLRAQQTVPQRERYERHVEAGHHRLLGQAAERISHVALERGWELGVVAGDPRGGRPVTDALAAAGIEVELVDRNLVELEPMHALAELAPVLSVSADRRDCTRVRRARDAAATGGRGAVGLAGVLGALGEGRVEQLLLGGDRTIRGALGPNGELVPVGIPPAGIPEAELRPEPLFADRIVLHALETGARVSVVGGEAASELADSDGVAALLRW